MNEDKLNVVDWAVQAIAQGIQEDGGLSQFEKIIALNAIIQNLDTATHTHEGIEAIRYQLRLVEEGDDD